MKWTIYSTNNGRLCDADNDEEMRALLLSLSDESRAPQDRADHAVSNDRIVFASDEVFRRALAVA